MLGSPFHSTKQSCKGTTDAFIECHSTAVYSQQTTEICQRKNLTWYWSHKNFPLLPSHQLGTTTCKTLGSVSAPCAQQMAMSQPGPAEASSEDLGNAKKQESCLVLKNVTNLCPCEGTTSSTSWPPAQTASPLARDAELSRRPSLWGTDMGWESVKADMPWGPSVSRAADPVLHNYLPKQPSQEDRNHLRCSRCSSVTSSCPMIQVQCLRGHLSFSSWDPRVAAWASGSLVWCWDGGFPGWYCQLLSAVCAQPW